MIKRVYLETSLISYLVATPRANTLGSAWQRVTSDSWERRRKHFDLFSSELVWTEASLGDPDAARRRLEVLEGIPPLEITDDVVALAKRLVDDGVLPRVAMDDAIHVAVSAVHGMDYLLTWNYRHLDNAEKKPLLRSVCAQAGFPCPEICTPQELMGEEDYD